MLAVGVFIFLLVAETLMAIFYPIVLPEVIIDGIKELLLPIYAFDGIVPVHAIFEGANWLLFLLVLVMIFKFIMGAIAMLSGGGKPEID